MLVNLEDEYYEIRPENEEIEEFWKSVSDSPYIFDRKWSSAKIAQGETLEQLQSWSADLVGDEVDRRRKIVLGSKLALALEREEVLYMKQDGRSAFDNERDDDRFKEWGLMFELPAEFKTKWLHDIFDDNGLERDGYLVSMYMRLFLAFSLKSNAPPIFDMLKGLHMCNEWILEGRQPLRCFATGLVAYIVKSRVLADAQVKESVPKVLLKRLRKMANATCTVEQKNRLKSSLKQHSTSFKRMLLLNIENTKYLGGTMDGSMKEENYAIKENDFLVREMLYVIDCLTSMGEYQEILEGAIFEDVLGSVMILLHSSSKVIIFYTLRMTSHLLAHKNIALDFVNAGSVPLLLHLYKHKNATYYQGALAMCFFGLASLTMVMEKLSPSVTKEMVNVSIAFMQSSDEHAKKHSVTFFGLSLAFPLVLQQFDERKGLVVLLTLVKSGLQTDISGAPMERQIAHHAALCIRQYFRAHVAQHARMFMNTDDQQFGKILDIDEKKILYYLTIVQQHADQAPIAYRNSVTLFLKQSGPKTLISLIDQIHGHTEFKAGIIEMCEFALETLQILALEDNVYAEFCQVDLSNGRNGMESILDCAANYTSHKDSDVVIAGLLALCHCICGGHSRQCCFSLFNQVEPQTTKSTIACICESPRKDIRNMARHKNILRVCTQLLRAKSPLHIVDDCRFLACRLLLGLSLDGQVVRILEEMRVGQLLVELIQNNSPSKDSVPPFQKFKDCALLLIAQLTKHAPASVLAEVSDSAIKRIKKAGIVSRAKVEFESHELLGVIHQHLLSHGLVETARQLEFEGNLSASSKDLSQESQVHKQKTSLNLKFKIKRSKKKVFDGSTAPSYFDHHAFAKGQKRSRSTTENGTYLEKIVSQYVNHQHRQCTEAIEVAPRFDLKSDQYSQKRVRQAHRAQTSNTLAMQLIRRQTGVYSKEQQNCIDSIVYSQYRPWRSYWDQNSYNLTVSAFLGNEKILTASDVGELRVFDMWSAEVVDIYTAHFGAITSISNCTSNRDILITSTMESSEYMPETRCWNLQNMNAPKFTIPDVMGGKLNQYGDLCVARRSDRSQANLYDMHTGELCTSLYNPFMANNYQNTCANFSSNNLVLHDGILWDPRQVALVKKFDKLSTHGMNYFHPSGNELIINAAIWDTRNFRLLRMCPSFDQCTLRFSTAGNIVYSYRQSHDDFNDFRKHNRFSTCFRVTSTLDYHEISTQELERPVLDLAIDEDDSYLAVIEGQLEPDNDHISMVDSCCRVYEVGRKPPSNSDSDAENSPDDSDDDWESTIQVGSDDNEMEDTSLSRVHGLFGSGGESSPDTSDRINIAAEEELFGLSDDSSDSSIRLTYRFEQD